MPFAYNTVSLNGNDYQIYGSSDDAVAYLAAAITATAWNSGTSDQQAQALVSGTRWLNGLSWLGNPTDPAQYPMALPRTGLVDASGAPIDPNTIPTGVAFALYEIAAGLMDDPTLFTSLNDPIFKEVKAGPVEATVFRPRDVQWLGVVPKSALGYIRSFLNYPVGGEVRAKGVHSKTPLERNFDFEHGI